MTIRRKQQIAARRTVCAAEDRARVRTLVRVAYNACRRADAALTRDPATDPTWLGRRLDEAVAALHRARNRLVLAWADVTVSAELDR